MRVGAILWALVLSALVCQPAFADKRVALVIGNSAYRNVARLTNPANDAAVLAETFRQAHFDVVDARNDLSITEMRRVLRDFGAKARDADIAVIYYAGHGIEVDGTNYLIPVDAQLETDTDAYDEAVSLDRALVAVESARQLRLIILDACRDNPFAKNMKRTIASRAIGRGLAKVEPTNPNTMIAFAAKAGFTAFDGDGKNGPFAVALAQHLTTPGLDLRKAFGFVRDDVLKSTGNRQEPFIYGSLGGDDVALVPAPSATAPSASVAPPPAADPNAAIRRDYELAAQVGTKEAWEFFIATYPDGFYAKLATAQRNKLLAEEARAMAAEKARLAAEEQATAEAKARAAAQARADEEARLVAAKAKAEADAKAARETKATEQARAAAEARRAAEEAKATEAERARAAAQAKAAEEEAKLAAAKARVQAAEEEARLAAAKTKAEELLQAKAAEDARIAAETRAAAPASKSIGPVAALTPPGQTAQTAPGDVARMLQSELRRVGCNTGAVDGNWNAAAQRSLVLFNKHAGTTLDTSVASLDALDIVKNKTSRICPLACEHGYKADGETCVKIVCKPGYQVGDDNSCTKLESNKPVAKREAPAAEPRREQAAPPQKPQAQSSGQIFCNMQGCRPVRSGCFIRGDKGGQQRQVCP